MMSGRILCLAGLLALVSAAAPRAEEAGPQAYDYMAEPLPGLQTRLLLQAKYQIQNDGTVLAPDSLPVPREDMPYIIQRLESGQRLKSLLQINLILNRSEGEKKLTPEERESIRAIVKENWEIFSMRLRREFRGYFSLQELELMNQVPLPSARLEEPALKDHDVVPPVAAAPAPVPVPIAAAPAPAPIPVPVPAVAAPIPAPAPVAAAPAPAPVPIAAVPAPAPIPVPVPAVAAPVPAPAPAAAAPAPAPVPVVVAPSAAPVAVPAEVVVLATTSPSAVEPSSPVPAPLPSPPAPVVAAPPAIAAELPLVDIPVETFEKLLAQAPYGREVKELLRLISEKAPFSRNRVLNDVMSVLPRIVIDPDRAGSRLYSRLESAPDAAPLISLNSGVAMTEESRLFFGKTTTYLPGSAKAYAEAGLPAPDLQALKDAAAPREREAGPWGDTAVYHDGSRRASFTPETRAGVLLAELVRLDARLRKWDASAAAVETVARTAQLLFYRALAASRRSDDFLDPLLRAAYRQWLEEPTAYHDMLLLGLSSSRSGVADPRKAVLAAVSAFNRNALADCVHASAAEAAYRDVSARGSREAELRAYEETDLFSEASLDAARQAAARAPAEARPPTPCRPEWAAEMAALAKAGVVLGEAMEAEKRMRQEMDAHAK